METRGLAAADGKRGGIVSRWIESAECADGSVEHIERLADADACRWPIDEVCCNAECKWCGDFPFAEHCSPDVCSCFEAGTADDIERLDDAR